MKTKYFFIFSLLTMIFANCSNGDTKNLNEKTDENTAPYYEVKSQNFRIQLPSSLVENKENKEVFFEAYNQSKDFTFQINVMTEEEFKKSKWYSVANNDSLSILENFHNYSTGMQYENNTISESRQKFTRFGSNEGLDTQMTLDGKLAGYKISILSFQAKNDLIFFFFKYPENQQKELKKDFSEIMESFSVL